MLRVDLAWVIETFQSIESVLVIGENDDPVDSWFLLNDVKMKLESIFVESVYSDHLKISRRRAEQFKSVVQPIMDYIVSKEFENPLNKVQAISAREAAKSFKLVFLSELSSVPVFLVTQKENYSIDHLIDNGIGLFPAHMLRKAPETAIDAEEVGRCFAFERDTACGFHTFRVVEAVLRRYWDVVSDGKKRPKPETLGRIAAALKDQQLGDVKVTESLQQLVKLHRNPLAHPDVILTSDEAISTLGLARSIITPMLSLLPDVLPTTGVGTEGDTGS